jgi:transcriptional regulator with XRE-family HTH domain
MHPAPTSRTLYATGLGESEKNHTEARLMKTSKLKCRRVELAMTQTELATAAKCSVASVARMESGQTKPSETLLPSLAKALNCTPTELRSWFKAQSIDAANDRRAVRRKAVPEAVSKPESAVCLSPRMVSRAAARMGQTEPAAKLRPVFSK